MNICLATDEFLPATGGIATYVHSLARILSGAGHNVTVLTSSEQMDVSDGEYLLVSLQEKVIETQFRLQERWGTYPDSVIRRLSSGLVMRSWLDENQDKYRFHVIEAPEYGGSAVFLAHQDLPPLAITLHGSFGQMRYYQEVRNGGAKYRVLVGMETQLMTLADGLSACSPMNAREWSNLLDREVRFVRAPWLSEITVSDFAAKRDSSAHPITGVAVGRLQNWKGATDLAAALRLCAERGKPVHVKWIGSDTTTAPDGGSMAQYLASEFSDVWESSFEWQGRLDRLSTRGIQANSDFAVTPSRWDTFNFTVVEAMSMGKPMVVSEGAGASYLIKDGVNGYVFPSRNSDALANALRKIAAAGNSLHIMGNAASRTIQAEFDPTRMIDERIEFYEHVIEIRQRRRKLPYLDFGSEMVNELLETGGFDTMRSIRRVAGNLKRSALRLNLAIGK